MLENETEQTPAPDETNVDYIEAIKELKQNTVAREDYNKIVAENKKLLQSLINGETIQGDAAAAPDITQLRKDLFGGERDLSNLEYATKALELRAALIAQGEKDPFVPFGKNIVPSDEDYKAAERVAEALQNCIDAADGDNAIFTNELQRIMVDSNPRGGRR